MAENDSKPAFRLRWDVFLSFRGEDTRDGFTARLYTELEGRGVRVFRDNDGLTQGDEIAPSLLDAIADSAVAIVILSRRYASSRWCLEELATICEYRRLILPVFYQVDPSDVRRQRGPFEDDFRTLEGRFGERKVARWRDAMEKAGGISGLVFQKSEERQLIQLLVRRILGELSNSPMCLALHTVGLNSRIEELMRVLDVKSNGVRVLGFHGMGGVGKTTLAKALYNQLVSHFEHRSFISNVRETSVQENGLASLQSKLLADLSLASSTASINDVKAGKIAIERVLHEKRVLVVLDDVDNVSQLGALAARREWFYEGSRIIITTRDRDVLLAHYVDEIHEVKELGSSDSLELFCYHALRRKIASEKFLNLSQQIVSLTGGLPLALEVFGSFLFDKRRVEEWEDALQKLKQIRPRHLQDVLKISFNGLDEEEKCVFLDIACLFVNIGMKRDEAIDVVKGCGFRAEVAINVLIARSLIKITEDEILRMHDQIRDMGRQIVCHESLEDPGKRSRLWDRGEIMTVLKDRMGTRRTQGIILNFEETNFFKGKISTSISWDVFLKTPNLTSVVTYLMEIYKVCFRYGAKKEGEVILQTEPFQSMVAENLMIMNLHGCYNLIAVPDLSRHRALEKLILERCTSLTTIHKSLGDVTTLRHLNLRDCSNLVNFPNDVSGLKHLDTLILSGCSKLKELPHDLRGLSSLRELLIDKTAIEKLPESIFRLTKLEVLSLNDCQSLKQLPIHIGRLSSLRDLSLNGSVLEELPDSIGLLLNLEKLSLMWCKSLATIPDSVCNLKSLTQFWLNGSSVKELPASIGSLLYLKDLSLGNCSSLTKLPATIGELACIVELQLDRTSIVDLPDQIKGLKSLEKLEMRDCKSLTSLPESIGHLLNLSMLIIVNAAITELPESIGMLENLVTLRLNKCVQLCKLPSSIGKLKFLHHLHMEGTSVTELPENFGMLSRLIILKMAKKPYREVSQNRENTELPKPILLPSSFSNLSLLEELDARAWKISGKIPDDFEKLSFLEILNLGHNDFHSLPCSLRGLTILKKLFVPHCKYLKGLPPLPSSLLELNAENCTALKIMHDISNLENLQDLNLANCEKLMGVPEIECIYDALLMQLALKNLYNLSVPGSEIPDWFTPEVVRYSKPKNLVIKAVIVGVIVSVNHQIPDDLRDQLPVVAGIEIKILRVNKPEPVYRTGPLLAGVPKNDDDHFYLCRYPDYHPLVSLLQEGDKVQVAMQDPPFVKGVRLKKCGIHLVFEYDDDYVGDENSLHESEQSVSQKLATFMGSSEDVNRILNSGSEAEREKQERKRGEELIHKNGKSFVLLLVILLSFFMLLSWLVFGFYS
ncbi:transmembrane receptor [Actinidia rufa]|uniref:Transmembrane receptor n=1 Tax=Actinidia rufa TaxID=165716 RepID=A0A7J0HER2_9ERIC|nr:transmembrane receptor [Actinidia rufa]